MRPPRRGRSAINPTSSTPSWRSRPSSGPEELLARCKQIESELGRQEGGVRHGPRPIDIDILLLGDIEYESERLRIPHRDLETRRFVLEPLMELAPDRVDEDRLAAVSDQRVERLP